jgi:hypothetical protein
MIAHCFTVFLSVLKTPRYAWGSGKLLAIHKKPPSFKMYVAAKPHTL